MLHVTFYSEKNVTRLLLSNTGMLDYRLLFCYIFIIWCAFVLITAWRIFLLIGSLGSPRPAQRHAGACRMRSAWGSICGAWMPLGSQWPRGARGGCAIGATCAAGPFVGCMAGRTTPVEKSRLATRSLACSMRACCVQCLGELSCVCVCVFVVTGARPSLSGNRSSFTGGPVLLRLYPLPADRDPEDGPMASARAAQPQSESESLRCANARVTSPLVSPWH